jgi:signal transduction histidine kinase/CheY-like chemotaxis protein
MEQSTPDSQVSVRKGLTLSAKFAMAVSALVLGLSLVYLTLAYVQMRRSAIAIAESQLGLVATQFAQLVQTAQIRLNHSALAASEDPRLHEFLTAPSAQTRASALVVLRSATDSGPLRIGGQLWSPRRTVALSDGRKAMVEDASRMAPLFADATRKSAPVFGPLTPEHDTLTFPVVVALRGNDSELGYLVIWRQLAALPGTRQELRTLIGQNVETYVGTRGGSGWTDLEHIVGPPGRLDTTTRIVTYVRPGVGRVYATPRFISGAPWAVVVEERAAAVFAEINRFLAQGALLSAVLVIAGVIGTIALSRQLTRPIVRLTEATARVAAGNYVEASNLPYKSDELGRLARSFDAMVDRVREAVESKRETERRAYEGQKMEAVAQLASGLAHDFNNFLTVIIAYTDFLLSSMPADDSRREDAEAIKAAGLSAAKLSRQLLIFSRQQVVQPQMLRLDIVAHETAKLLRPVLGETIDLVMTCATETGFVKVDPGQIEQILVNLAVNARDAMPNGGRLIIETKNAEFLGGMSGVPSPYPAGQYVTLVVSDTGVGMNPETMARIFEPFFTTKEPGKGTGLGLATVYGIVQQSGGHIFAYSEPGHGTSFKLYFPRVDAPEAHTALATSEVPRGTEDILVVEDQAAVRNVVREVLERQGYRVLEAPDGKTALDLATKHPAIHLVITDVVMPQMGGRGLADALRTLRPTIKVLFMSGYTGDAVLRQGIRESALHYIEKPFDAASLARKVRAVLDSDAVSEGDRAFTADRSTRD